MLKEIHNALKLIKFDKEVISSVVGDESTTKYGFLILFVTPFLSVFFAALKYSSGLGSLFSKYLFWPLMIPFVSLTFVFFLEAFFLRKIYKVKIKYLPLFRVLSYASIVFILMVVFFILSLFGLNLGDNFLNFLFFSAFFFLLNLNYRFISLVYSLKKSSILVVLCFSVFAYLFVNYFLGIFLVGSSYNILF